MKIICQNCNKKGECKTTSASYRDKVHGIGTTVWRQVVCDKCNYVADEWENARYNFEDPRYGNEDLDSIGMEGYGKNLIPQENIEQKNKSQLIKLENHPIYDEMIIYSEEELAGFISAEELFKDLEIRRENFKNELSKNKNLKKELLRDLEL